MAGWLLFWGGLFLIPCAITAACVTTLVKLHFYLVLARQVGAAAASGRSGLFAAGLDGPR